MKVLKNWIVSISFLLFLFVFIPTVHADEGELFQVGTSELEIKHSPYKESETVGQLVSGDKVTVFREKSGWLQTFYRGEVAWVASQYLIPISEAPMDQSVSVTEKKYPEKVQTVTEKGKTINLPIESNTVKPPKVLLGTTEITLNETNSLSGYQFVIDAGHGGKDSGATSHGVIEKDLTLSTAKKVANKLENEGAAVTLSRSDDTYISLEERVNISNENQTDAFISIHYNAYPDPGAEGISTHFSTGDQNRKLARDIQTSLISDTSLNDRGTKQSNYHVLRNNNQLAVLVELGFITNPTELETIKTSTYQDNIVQGITNGLQHYFGE